MKFSVKIVWHYCDLEIMSRSLKEWSTGKAQSVVPSCFVLMFTTLMVPEKILMLKFSRSQKIINYLPWTHPWVTQFKLCMIFLMYIATLQYLNNSRQESEHEYKKHDLQFTFVTHLWPWNKVKVIKSAMKM